MRRRVVIDMTPLTPDGRTGGSAMVATSLIREMSRLRPDWELALLTSSQGHAELAILDSDNVRRQRVLDDEPADSARNLARRVIGGLPAPVRVRAKNAVWRLRHRPTANGKQADLMLCPFTSSNFWQPGVRLVAIVHDLQHVAYPGFFSDEQRLNRDRHLREAASHADVVVCVSEFVRQTLREHTGIEDDRTVTIHNGLLHDFQPHAAADLDRFLVPPGQYLLYPANFWPHKNHALLIDALAGFQRQRPASGMMLVCTGAPNAAMEALRARADRETVRFTGYVSEEEYATLLDNCAALIYPSLYEGFGMPVLEAMARGKPVLCSELPGLREVAGDAAFYFDPTNCEDIIGAVRSLADDSEGTARRAECGQDRAKQFGDAASMTQRYIDLFERILDRQ